MSLTKLTPRHVAIIRRLLTGQPDFEIAIEVNISNSYLSALKNDPLFAAELERMSYEIEARYLANMGDTQVILDRLKTPAALRLKEMVELGTVGGREIGANKQADIVTKALDITGVSQRSDVNADIYENITEAVVEAYRRKNLLEGGKVHVDPLYKAIDISPIQREG